MKDSRGLLTHRVFRLLIYAVVVYIVLQVVPGLEKALKNLESVRPLWVLAAMGVETLSEMGYVVAWRGILDPDDLLYKAGRGRHLAARVAWAQLGGGMVVPGGTVGSMGVGAWMLHRLQMPMEKIAERQFVLMFLNTGVDGLATVFFGLGLFFGIFSGSDELGLTLVPAVAVVVGFVLVLFVAGRAVNFSNRLKPRRPRAAKAVLTFAQSVRGSWNILTRRGSGKIVLGSIVYLGFDMLVLWGALKAVHADVMPTFAVVAMSYLVGGLAGSIPLPASLGAIAGMAGMLVVFGVDHNDAIAGVVLYQAIGFLVPIIGGGISYLFLRHEIASMHDEEEPSVSRM